MTVDNIDTDDFNKECDDKEKVADFWVPCRICQEVFLRIRLTKRYCATCKRAFCEGEHGNFAGRGVAVCVQCHRPANR